MKNQKITRRGAVLTRPASKKYPNKKGITLISLVVTIIILLILAGVTLALISGSDGILGRASHALDENKIAMAKEQVELALSDFQTEFFEGKYVERTNDGTKKEYISEKLQTGVETTNFYAKASVEGNVIVYEGKDTSGTEVVKGSIQNDASIKWDDITGGSVGKDEETNKGEDTSNGTGGNVNSEDLTELRATIAQLQGEVSSLKTQLNTTNHTLDSILTSQTRKDIIYEGNATQEGTYNFSFLEGKKLEDYKMLLFFTDGYYTEANTWIGEEIVLVEAKVNNIKWRYRSTYELNENARWELWFSINASNQFKIDAIHIGRAYSSARIYKVIGIY